MPQPPAYNRQFDFSDYQSSFPNQPLPGHQVDIEFDAVKTTVDAVRNNMALIQRDDGRLRNQSVGVDQIASDLAALISNTEVRGDWAPATSYQPGDIVKGPDGATYFASEAHISSSDFETDRDDKWFLFANPQNALGEVYFQGFDGDGAETDFNLSVNITDLKQIMVFVEGEFQDYDTLTLLDSTTLRFSSPPPIGVRNILVSGSNIQQVASLNAALDAAQDAIDAAEDAEDARDALILNAGYQAVAADLATPGGDIETVAANLGTGEALTVIAAELEPSGVLTDIYGSLTAINTVSTNIGDVDTIVTNISAVNTVAADLDGTDTIGTVAGGIANVNAVAGSIASVNAVAGNATNINAVAANATNINTVAGDSTEINAIAPYVGDIVTVEGALADIYVVASDLNGDNDISTVATGITAIGTVASDITSVNTVAAGISDVETVADNISAVTTVQTISDQVVAVAAIDGDVTAVAAIDTDVTAVAGVTDEVQIVADNVELLGEILTGEEVVLEDFDEFSGGGVGYPVNGPGGIVWGFGTDGNQSGMFFIRSTNGSTLTSPVGINIQNSNNSANDYFAAIKCENVDFSAYQKIVFDVQTPSGSAGGYIIVTGSDADVNTPAVPNDGQFHTIEITGDLSNITLEIGCYGPDSNPGGVGGTINVSAIRGIGQPQLATVADIADEIVAVSNIDSAVVTVSGMASDITNILTIQSDIETVADNISTIEDLADIAPELQPAFDAAETVLEDFSQSTSAPPGSPTYPTGNGITWGPGANGLQPGQQFEQSSNFSTGVYSWRVENGNVIDQLPAGLRTDNNDWSAYSAIAFDVYQDGGFGTLWINHGGVWADPIPLFTGWNNIVLSAGDYDLSLMTIDVQVEYGLGSNVMYVSNLRGLMASPFDMVIDALGGNAADLKTYIGLPTVSTANFVPRFSDGEGAMVASPLFVNSAGRTFGTLSYFFAINSSFTLDPAFYPSGSVFRVQQASDVPITVTIEDDVFLAGEEYTFIQCGTEDINFVYAGNTGSAALGGGAINNVDGHLKIAGQWGKVNLHCIGSPASGESVWVLSGDTKA